ncbi:MAG: tryptophan synthase subunit beta [Aminobacterium colombiense]|jgi:tryptophan synthase beta chain|uniref:tryptophan synthase subunit beta n=1 Tax=Aminobacterium colombiense TaxID=81468 RepID=UPI003D988624|nr:tryptophan synthase subunit beta [Aminobacterium colombiense]MDD3768631.1 tryptophan synthase subunit beta [Aminobacterium colombiense]MDD4265528.1 tryptophan synthase subunit beta [Aminobacterium colombiense]
MIQKNRKGYFGEYGGSFVPEALQVRLDELEEAYEEAKKDPSFSNEFITVLKEYVGRPSALTECKNISRHFGGGRLFLKREDLNHTGAHKINNALGQALLARRMGKNELIAETGAGMHGTASATVAALMGMKCTVYMGAVDVARQAPNVARMKVLGTEIVAVQDGQKTLKEAVDAALKAFAEQPDTFYLLGSAVGPHPYPTMVRDFQSIIGKEARSQFLEREQKLPDYAIACVGGGSNAIGLFSGFLDDSEVKIIGVEPAGKGLATGEHAATLSVGQPNIIHGFKSYVLSKENGESAEVYSISAGLDYPGVGPEHAYLKDIGRVDYKSVTDEEAIDAFKLLSNKEGIIPALESSHALAYAFKLLPALAKDQTVLVNLSGRGDKDMDTVLPLLV